MNISSDGTGPEKPASGSGKGGFVPPSTDDLDAILDQYEFIELLGRGGMGAVYKARQKSLDRLVAIKILPPHLTTDEEEQGFHFAERFQREAKAMAKLSHPHIIGVYDFGQAKDGQFYFVMEYVEGTDLHALIKGGELTLAHVTGWMSQICEALQYAHGKGIVHRDIKPANIMITREGAVKIADFGLAKLTGGEAMETKLTMTNMAMGTPDYVAPEALEIGVEVDHRADLYALGVMLYEMLTGKVPRGAWKMPSAQVEGLDPRYDALIERAMDSDREGRFQQASEISATIYEIATTAAKPARPKLAMGNAPAKSTPAVSGPAAKESASPRDPQKAAAAKHPSPAIPPPKKSPVGIIVGLAGGALALGLGVFFIFKPKDTPVTLPPSIPAVTPLVSETAPVPSKPAPEPVSKSVPPPAKSVPPTPKAVPVASPAQPMSTVDLLATVDLTRDVLSGDWSRGPGGLTVQSPYPTFPTGEPRLQFDQNAPEEYDLEAEFTPTEGDGIIALNLRAGENPVRLVLDLTNDKQTFYSGFVRIEGKGIDEAPGGSIKGSQRVPNGTRARLRVEVQRGELRAFLNGEPLVNWSGDFKTLSVLPTQALRDPRGLGIAAYKRTVTFHRVTLAAPGGLPSALAATPAPPPAPPLAEAIDLISLVDVPRDTMAGTWTMTPEGLAAQESGNGATLIFPHQAPEEYDYEVEFTIGGRGNSIYNRCVLVLPLPHGVILWAMQWGPPNPDGTTAFAFGPKLDNLLPYMPGRTEGMLIRPILSKGHRYRCLVEVRKDSLRALLDGEEIVKWSGDLSRFDGEPTYQGVKDPTRPGVNTYRTELVFHKAELRPPGGKPLPEKTAPETTPAMTQAPATPATPTPTAPNDPVSLKLAELEKAFLAAYEKQVAPAHDTAVAALNTSYLARLDRDIAAASKAGKLDEALALRDERAQIETHRTLPAEDAPALAAAIKALRATYRGTMATLLKQRDLAAAPLYAAYDRTLASYQDELTKSQQLDAAARVKAVREHVATQRESAASPAAASGASATSAEPAPTLVGQKSAASETPVPVAPPLAASQILPPLPKPSQDDIRSMADWIFRGSGNWIRIAEGPVSRQIKQSADLPRGNLKVVGLHVYLDDSAVDGEVSKFLTTVGGLTDLETLDLFSDGRKSPLAIETLRGLTKLKSLNLTGVFDDSGFAHLSGLKNLNDVRIIGKPGFSGTGLGYLGTGIESLDLRGNTHLATEGLAYLSRFRKLRVLYLSSCPSLKDEMLRPLAALADLELLEVFSTPLNGSFLAALPDNSKLTYLDLGDLPNAKPEFLTHLARLKNLEKVGLPPLDLPRETIMTLASLGKLQKLSVSSPFTGETLNGVTGFRILTDLDLKQSPVTDAGWAAIVQAMPALEQITLDRPAGSTAPQNAAAMGDAIGRLKNLRFLSFGGPTFTDDWLLAASRAKNLDALHVSSPLVTDAGLVHLQDLPLTGLRINGTSITDASIPTLKKFPKLFANYIYFPAKMSPAGIAEVKAHCDNRKK